MATGSSPAPQPAITIRRATPEDLPALWPLLDAYYTEWQVQQRDTPDDIAHYLDAPSPLGFLVAEHDGTLVGCVLLRDLRSIPSAAECKRLFVVPSFRGHRLASQLMDHAERLASATLDWIYLDTADAFTAAISLYQRRGYQPCARYNDNPQATFFFRKSLRPST